MPKIKLTATFCLTAQCTPGKRKTDYWDTHITGWVLSVRESGGRTYCMRFISNGRQREYKIAGFADISFDQARKAARRLRSEIVLGGDPAGEKADKKAIPAYADLAVQHLAHAKTYQRSYDSTEMIMRRHVLPQWAKQRLDEIRPHDIAKWLAAKSDEGLKPATVEKIRVVFLSLIHI